ncbi:hypothetical protein H0H93_015026 [Arthromyces matolae]|nr:hypothetical protein H0H93_015026 [Arthromyces matolae]
MAQAMKSESESSTSTPAPQTPALAYTASQWATASPTYGHYGAYAAAVAQHSAAAATTPATTTPAVQRPVATPAPAANTGIDTSDIATLNDALGSAGVDLRAEEETLQRTHESQQTSYRSFEDRSRKQPPTPSFDTRILGATMRTIGTQHKVTKIPDDSTNYMALALRARLQDLITAMISASHHRTDTQFDRPASLYDDNTPMWSIVVRSDVAKQLAVLEKVEREEETRIRRERKERQDMAAAHAAALAAQANGTAMLTGDGMDELEGGAKKKRKKEGPGVTARNMSEDVRKKMSNAVATQAAGLGGKYAWMNASSSAAATPKAKKDPPAAATASTSATTAVTGSPNPSGATAPTASPAAAALTSTPAGSTWARPYVSAKKSSTPTAPAEEEDTRTLVTMRDAMFVIEKERGHGGGKGAVRGWSGSC